MAKISNQDLSGLEYNLDGDDTVVVKFLRDGSSEPRTSGPKQEVVATLVIELVNISFYAKQHLQKQPTLLECGVIISGSTVETFLIPTGRTRMAGNGSVGVKYYDVVKPIKDDEIEKYERVGIRPPSGVFTYAFFEAQYLARSEDPRRGALFLIDPRMIVLQFPMSHAQKSEFQTFGGKKVLYFDVLDAPNLQERKEEIKRCRMRGDDQRRQYEEADKKWEEEMEERLARKALEEDAKPKLSKKAKQKARQAKKRGAENGRDVGEPDDGELERLHKQKQAESRAKVEEDLRRERELEAERKKLEAAEVKRQAEAEAARMSRVKNLLQKVQTSLRPRGEADGCGALPSDANAEEEDDAAYESSNESVGSDRNRPKNSQA